jgi:menaquinone-dependent protoporphyrinogen oxidase
MKILIAYSSVEGQTRRIAEKCAEHLRGQKHNVQVVDSGHLQTDFDIFPFDAAILAASVHHQQHHNEILDFVIDHKDWLEGKPTALLSVSLSAAFEEDREEANLYIDQFAYETDWRPDCALAVAGAIRYKKYDFFRRWAMRFMANAKGAPTDATRDHEFTDWDALYAFVDKFVVTCSQKT